MLMPRARIQLQVSTSAGFAGRMFYLGSHECFAKTHHDCRKVDPVRLLCFWFHGFSKATTLKTQEIRKERTSVGVKDLKERTAT